MKNQSNFRWTLIVVSSGFVLGTVFFLFTRYMLKGYIDKIDCILASLMIVVGIIFILRLFYSKNRNEKEDKNA
jgi:Mn2+/Fe2+ NRAMP family transporter